MFCAKCGKEIPDDSAICGYCGTAIQGRVTPPNDDTRLGYGEQANYGGQPGYGNQQNYGGQPGYGNQQYSPQDYGSQQGAGRRFKPDHKFNVWAFLFTFWWPLFHGLFGVSLISFLIGFIFWILVVGQTIGVILGLIFKVIVGRTGNYYYRLKEQQKISIFKAIRDPNLRRF